MERVAVVLCGGGDPSTRECLIVATVASALGSTVDLVTDPGHTATAALAAAAVPFRPLLFFPDSGIAVHGVDAIARFFVRHAGMALSAAEDSATAAVIGELFGRLDGVRRESISIALSHFESLLISFGGEAVGLLPAGKGTEVGGFRSVADLYLWAAVARSPRTLPLDDFPKLQILMRQGTECPIVRKSMSLLHLSDSSIDSLYLQRRLTQQSKFYISTAINYTNGPPHMGHAYEAVTADAIARYHRIFGRSTFFLTGTDEHGQKIAATAERLGREPIDICNEHAAGFQRLNAKLHISEDDFIRTTSATHQRTAQWLWDRCEKNGDIYLGQYSGWYNVREEAFVTDRQAEETDFKDPQTGLPLQKTEEASYFFRLSKYQEPLLSHMESHPEFVQPEARRNDVLHRLTSQKLENLSTSRTNFTWGIPVPNDPDHVMYVWFDALSNYLTGVEFPWEGDLSHFWPCNVHIIGKDITWFHCVIWPSMLLSAGIPLPDCVFAHGFVSASDGRKMSKSFGNVMDPTSILEMMPADAFRYFLLKEARYGADLKFDLHAMHDLVNADLADVVGNLVHRTVALCQKFSEGRVPDAHLPRGPPPFEFQRLAIEVEMRMKSFSIQEAVEAIMHAARDTNKYLTDKAPWSQTDPEVARGTIRGVIEAVYILAHFLEPAIPRAAEEVFARLGTPRRTLCELSPWYDNLTPGTPVTGGAVLFSKLMAPQ